MRLALALGKTLSELDQLMSAQEFMLWQSFDDLEPLGERRADIRNGMAMALYANVHRAPNAAAFRPIDFMPYDRGYVEEEARRAARVQAEISAKARVFFDAYRSRQQLKG